MELLTSAINQDYLPAFVRLVHLYATGKVIQQDPEKAEALIRVAAESGYARAQFILGSMYMKTFPNDLHDSPFLNSWLNTNDSPSDHEYNQQMAIYWITLAADQEHYFSKHILISFYYKMLQKTHDISLRKEVFIKFLRYRTLKSCTLVETETYIEKIRGILQHYAIPFISEKLFNQLRRDVFEHADVKLHKTALYYLCGFLHNFSGNAYELSLLDSLRPIFERLTDNAPEELEKYWPPIRSLNDQALIQIVQSQHAQIIELQQQVRALQQSQMTSTANLSVVEDEEPEEEPRVKKHSHSDEEEIEAAIDAEHTNDHLQDQFRFVGKRAKKSKITTPPEEMPQNSDDSGKGSSLD